MITLYFGETPHRFPNAWEKLTAGQYLRLVELLGLFWAGALSMCDLRIAFFGTSPGWSISASRPMRGNAFSTTS